MSAVTTPTFRPRNVESVHRGGTETIDVLGIRMEWNATEQDPGHQYCLFEMTIPPGTGVPLNHHEPQETFWVVDGELEFGRVGEVGPEWFRIAAGDAINVPSWAFHGFRNRGERAARMLLLCTAGLEPFSREVGIPVASGSAFAAGPPTPAEIERVFTAALKSPCYPYSVP